jgi:hypothetical protein
MCKMVAFAAVTTATTDIECPGLQPIAAAPQKSSPRWWLCAAVLAAAALLAVSTIATLSAEVQQLSSQLEVERSSSRSRALQQLNETQCGPVVQAFNGTRRLEVGVTSTRSMQLTADLMGGTKGEFCKRITWIKCLQCCRDCCASVLLLHCTVTRLSM